MFQQYIEEKKFKDNKNIVKNFYYLKYNDFSHSKQNRILPRDDSYTDLG